VQFLTGLAGVIFVFVAANYWYITITWLLYLIWRELRLIRAR